MDNNKQRNEIFAWSMMLACLVIMVIAVTFGIKFFNDDGWFATVMFGLCGCFTFTFAGFGYYFANLADKFGD